MKVGVVKEKNDLRVAMVPDAAKKMLQMKGITLTVEAGLTPMISDASFIKAGAVVSNDREALIRESDVLLWVNAPQPADIAKMERGTLSVSFIDPFNNKELIKKFLRYGISTVSMEMIPRTTIAQKMDALSSQASLAGYVAVILGANALDRIFPMMVTPSGTIPPAKVLVIGAGVAGLQAIATAKRLGAKVEAFDTRAVVEEQVISLGARFIKVDLGETGQTKDGYAKALTEEQLGRQQLAMAKSCTHADLVITTAKLFGKKAPVIITKDILKNMRDGSVIVDLAAGSGGNVEGTVVDKKVFIEGVQVIGIDNLPGNVAFDASCMYANNLTNFIEHFYDSDRGKLSLDTTNDIMKGCLITLDGVLVNDDLKAYFGGDL